MGFLSASFLFAIPLAAVPIVIHLLNRRQRQLIRWGAMQFLLESSSRRRRLWRVDDLIVMLLRAMAILFLIVALSEPLLRFTWYGIGNGRDVILIIDASLSTARTSDSGQVFDAIRQQTTRLLGELREGDTIRLMVALESPKWLTPVAVPVDSERRLQLKTIVADLKPTQATANFPAAIEAAVDSGDVEASARHIVVFTDNCLYGWQHGAIPRWRAIRHLRESREIHTVVNVVRPMPAASISTNLSVDKVNAARFTVGANEPFTLAAEVRNTGPVSSPPVMLRWTADDVPLGVTSVPTLTPTEAATIQLPHSIGSAGTYRVRVELDHADELPLDDSATVVIEVTERVPILIVHAGPEDELRYLLAALGRPTQSKPDSDIQPSVFAPTVTSPERADSYELESFRAVMLVHVGTFSEALLQRLATYTAEGGGLWVTLGHRTQVESFNSEFYEHGLSPSRILPAMGNASDRDQFVLVSPPSAVYRPTSLLGDTKRLDIDDVHIYRHWTFELEEDRHDVQVLLETEHGTPLAVEHFRGDGRIVLLGVPLDLSWSNLALHQAYVAMVHEWLWYLTEPTATKYNVTSGTPLELRLPKQSERASRTPDGAAERAIVKIPSGAQLEVRTTTDATTRRVTFRDTRLPGEYEISVPGGPDEADRKVTPFHVNRDATESNLELMTAAHRELLSQAGGIHFVEKAWQQPQGVAATAVMRPVAYWFLLGLLTMLLAELLLTSWSAHRRFVRPDGAA